MVTLSPQYEDEFDFFRKRFLAQWTNRGLTVNVSEEKTHGKRYFTHGKWVIVSSDGRSENVAGRLSEGLLSNIVSSEKSYTKEDAPQNAELYVGYVELFLGQPDPLAELLKKTLFVSSIIKEKGVRGKVIGESIIEKRVITHTEGEASELKQFTLFTIEILGRRGDQLVRGSAYANSLGDPSRIVERSLEIAVESAYRKVSWVAMSSSIEGGERGAKTLVLSPAAASTVIRALIKEMNLNPMNKWQPGLRVAQYGFDLRDDPLRPNSPASRAFDDEGVRTIKKTIIEKGEFVEYLGTRFEKRKFSRPGNAYGLWEPPSPLHSNLLLAKGDWSDKEIVEETRDGFYIDGVDSHVTKDGVLTIYPEASWRIRKGEVEGPCFIREVKLPLLEGIENIDSVGRTVERFCSWEGSWVVCEEAPTVRVKGHVL